MVGQPDKLEVLDPARIGSQVAEPGSGQSERLRHGANHDKSLVLGQQPERGSFLVPGKLPIGLVNHDQPRSALTYPLDQLDLYSGARRIVRRGEEHQIDLTFAYGPYL